MNDNESFININTSSTRINELLMISSQTYSITYEEQQQVCETYSWQSDDDYNDYNYTINEITDILGNIETKCLDTYECRRDVIDLVNRYEYNY